MYNITSSKSTTSTSIVRFVSIVAFIIASYIIFNPIRTEGGELLFSLPLSLSVCTFLYPKLWEYQRGGWGLKVYYTVIIVRYLLVPFLTCIQGHFSIGGISAYALFAYSKPESYFYALVAMNIELIVALSVINKYYNETYLKIKRKLLSEKRSNHAISLVGMLMVLFFVILIISRGGVGAYIRMGIVSEELNYDAQVGNHGIDVEIIKPLMGFLVITISAYFSKLYAKKKKILYFILPMLMAMFSCILIVGNNRMQMVYLSLCALSVLVLAFPDYKSIIKGTILPTLAVILIAFTMFKQFGVDVKSKSASSVESSDALIGLTEYVCGPENIAHTCDNWLKNGHKVNSLTPISDFIKYNHLCRLPGFSSFKTFVEKEPTTIDLAVSTFEMISIAGMCLYYGHSMIGGWLLLVLFTFIVVRFLLYFDIKSQLSTSLGSVYIYNWCAILFGVSMCYTLVTLWDNITYVPVFIWVLLKINNFRFKKSYEGKY